MWRSMYAKGLMLDCILKPMHWFWTVEAERPSTAAHDKMTSKMRSLHSRRNLPVVAQAYASHFSLPSPFCLLFLKYNTCAQLKGRVEYGLRPPAQSYFILVWVTGWSGPSVYHLSGLQLEISLDRHATVPSRPAWVAEGDPPSTLPDALAIFCSSLPRPHFYRLFVFVPAKSTSQDRSVQCSGAGRQQWLGCLLVTWCSRGVVLPCGLPGMNWFSRFLKTHGVSDPFLELISRTGHFMIRTEN